MPGPIDPVAEQEAVDCVMARNQWDLTQAMLIESIVDDVNQDLPLVGKIMLIR